MFIYIKTLIFFGFIFKSLDIYKLISFLCCQNYEEKTELMDKTSEKETNPILQYRLEELDRQQLTALCSYLGLHGASFYTMRDKLVYGIGKFDYWELKGVKEMIHEFDPIYEGEPDEFYESCTQKVQFIQFMIDKGGMGKSSAYHRFRMFNFKKWEVLGLEYLLGQFLELHNN